MEIIYKVELINGKEEGIIYVRYPDTYEFGLDFKAFKRNVSDISSKIKEYISKNIKNFSTNTAILVLNGIVVGTLVFSNLNYTKFESKYNNLNSEIESINTLKKDDELLNPKLVNLENAQAELKIEPKIENVSSTNIATTSYKSNTTSQMINLKLSSGQIINISLEDYVIGVVGSEMPAEFHSEALKAQAVAARTYALKRISSGHTLTATNADQVYKTNNELKALWGNSYNTYYEKVKNAVKSTAGEYMTYNGQYIDALYFSTSNGSTEDSSFVWGNSLPYLKPVDSHWDVGVRGFEETKTIPMSTISQKLGVNLTSVSQIKINSKTTSGRVNSITICNKNFTGVQIRTLLGLRSTDFSCSQSGNSIVFTTKGFGHGVGMSQYGANGMAKEGYSYDKILKHYFTGINISKK